VPARCVTAGFDGLCTMPPCRQTDYYCSRVLGVFGVLKVLEVFGA